MDNKALEKELEAAYEKLASTENSLKIVTIERNKQFKIEEVLIAAGFLTRQKIREAEDILGGLND